jgi:glycosyltransferase involved in cell wall biosynthesis
LADLSIFVCTYNSSATLEECLSGIERAAEGARLILIDHESSDGTVETAKLHDAYVLSESVSLGHARQMAFETADTEFMAFVDSDVEIVEPNFFRKAIEELGRKEVGAVVGMAAGHRLAYGLPASLLVLRSKDFRGKVIPDYIDARETYFIQGRLDNLGLETVYLADAIIHRSQFRHNKPEWEGANTRLACGIKAGQLMFALKVMVLMSLNSKSLKNIAYVPVFYLKFLRGFANPSPWLKLERRTR